VRGGRRAGAGRPLGSKTKYTHDAKLAAEQVLERFEGRIVARLLRTRDDRVLLEFLKLLRAYSSGKPTERLQVESSSFSAEAILTQLWEQEQGERRLLPSGDTAADDGGQDDDDEPEGRP
jgi:hypothetical protein